MKRLDEQINELKDAVFTLEDKINFLEDDIRKLKGKAEEHDIAIFGVKENKNYE